MGTHPLRPLERLVAAAARRQVSTPAEKIRAAFPGATWKGASARDRCPAHDDRHASLSLRIEPDGKALIYCHAHCAIVDILARVNLTERDLFPSNGSGNGNGHHRPAPAPRIVATYDFTDTDGTLLYQEVKLEPKDFRLRRPDGNGGWTWKLDGVERVPYRLPELLAAEADEWVFVTEGPKDADNLVARGLVATTNAGGAGKWDASWTRYFHGRKVAILCDNDGTGYAGGLKVAGSLYGLTRRLVLIDFRELPEKGDVSDWLAMGHTDTDLIARAELAEEWRPDADPSAARIEQLGRELAEAHAEIERLKAREAAILAIIASRHLDPQAKITGIPLAYELERRQGWRMNEGKPLVPLPLAAVAAGSGQKEGAAGRAVKGLSAELGWLSKQKADHRDEKTGEHRSTLHMGGVGRTVPEILGSLALAAEAATATAPEPDRKWGGARVPGCKACAPGTPVRVTRLLHVTCVGCGTVLLDESAPAPEPTDLQTCRTVEAEQSAKPEPEPVLASETQDPTILQTCRTLPTADPKEEDSFPSNVLGVKFAERSPAGDPRFGLTVAQRAHCAYAHSGAMVPFHRTSWGEDQCSVCYPPLPPPGPPRPPQPGIGVRP